MKAPQRPAVTAGRRREIPDRLTYCAPGSSAIDPPSVTPKRRGRPPKSASASAGTGIGPAMPQCQRTANTADLVAAAGFSGAAQRLVAGLSANEVAGLERVSSRATSWSLAELLVYYAGLKAYGKDCERVSRAMNGSKTPYQVETFYRNWNRRFPPMTKYLNSSTATAKALDDAPRNRIQPKRVSVTPENTPSANRRSEHQVDTANNGLMRRKSSARLKVRRQIMEDRTACGKKRSTVGGRRKRRGKIAGGRMTCEAFEPGAPSVRPVRRFVRGMRVEAVDYTNCWYRAEVVAVNTDAREVLVRFIGWPSTFDQLMPFDSPKIRLAGRLDVLAKKIAKTRTIAPKRDPKPRSERSPSPAWNLPGSGSDLGLHRRARTRKQTELFSIDHTAQKKEQIEPLKLEPIELKEPQGQTSEDAKSAKQLTSEHKEAQPAVVPPLADKHILAERSVIVPDESQSDTTSVNSTEPVTVLQRDDKDAPKPAPQTPSASSTLDEQSCKACITKRHIAHTCAKSLARKAAAAEAAGLPIPSRYRRPLSQAAASYRVHTGLAPYQKPIRRVADVISGRRRSSETEGRATVGGIAGNGFLLDPSFAPKHAERIIFKEIKTPTYRDVTKAATVFNFPPVTTKRSIHTSGTEEDISDETFSKRHAPHEAVEKERHLEFMLDMERRHRGSREPTSPIHQASATSNESCISQRRGTANGKDRWANIPPFGPRMGHG